MPYASLRAAIRERFAKYENLPTSVASGDDRSVGDEPLMVTLRVGGRALRVCVFDTDSQGQSAMLWPSISFARVGERPRREDTHFGDVLRENFGTAYQHDLATLTERSGADLVALLPGPEPITLTYEFRIQALTQNEADTLLTVVKNLWPQLGAIQHRQRDGSVSEIDVIRTEGPTNVSGLDPTLPEGEPGYRFWAWTITYEFQAYEDNTLQAELVPTVRKRVLELGDEDPEAEPAAVVVLDEHRSP